MLPLQTVLGAVQEPPVQQGPPAAPQAWHVFVVVLQAVPGSLQAGLVVVEVGQQVWLRPPHTLHR